MVDDLLEITGLNKSFWSVPVLTDIDLSIRRGEVYALVGENGAGKSTLIKIISGAYDCDSGDMVFDGQRYKVHSPAEGLKKGIVVIYQETSLVPTLTLLENIFLGIEPVSGPLGVCRKDQERRRFQELCDRIGYQLPAERKVKDIGPAERKLAEIVKALAHEAQLIIMDEPTDSLSGGEIESFFRVVEDLKAKGITVIYITHYLKELFRISDRLTVLKDGRKVATRDVADVTTDEIVALMLGDAENQGEVEKKAGTGELGPEVLYAEDVAKGNAVRGVTLRLRRGEVAGLVGVIGSGKTELARLLFGADRLDSGAIYVKGKKAGKLTPRLAKAAGIGFLPEDRKTQGLLQNSAVRNNLTLAALQKVSSGQVVSSRREQSCCKTLVESLSIKIAGLEQRVRYLSGGNQQKW